MDLTRWSKRSRQIAIKYGELKDRYEFWESDFPGSSEHQYLAHLLLILGTKYADAYFINIILYNEDTVDRDEYCIELRDVLIKKGNELLDLYGHLERVVGYLTPFFSYRKKELEKNLRDLKLAAEN